MNRTTIRRWAWRVALVLFVGGFLLGLLNQVGGGQRPPGGAGAGYLAADRGRLDQLSTRLATGQTPGVSDLNGDTAQEAQGALIGQAAGSATGDDQGQADTDVAMILLRQASYLTMPVRCLLPYQGVEKVGSAANYSVN